MAATVRQLALVTESTSVRPSALATAAAAVQTQITRDFAPAWRRPATIVTHTKLTDVPVEAWPVIVMDDLPGGAEGVHLDRDGQPYALVHADDGWSLTVSHEALEMLGDPFGRRTRKAHSLMEGQGVVRYLVEVCDPCEAAAYAYRIDGVVVSDFYTPAFFDPAPRRGHRYSHTGAITAPLQVLEGGYLSWQDPVTRHWWQQVWFGSQPSFRDLGVLGARDNPRAATDAGTMARRRAHVAGPVAPLRRSEVEATAAARRRRAHDLLEDVEKLVAEVR